MKFNITVSQFAERIGRSASYVRAHLAAGTMRIPYLKEGNRVRFCEEDVQDFIDEHTHRPEDEASPVRVAMDGDIETLIEESSR